MSKISELSDGGALLATDNLIVVRSGGNVRAQLSAISGQSVSATTLAASGATTLSSTLAVSGVITATSLDISGDIDVDGTSNLDVVDIDGAVDMASTLTVTGKITADAGIDIDNINIDGTTIALSSGSLTLDVAGQLIVDCDDEGTLTFKNSGTQYGLIYNQSNDFTFKSLISDGDILFQGNDGGVGITALTLDMSAAGFATFNNGIKAGRDISAYGANTGSVANRMALSMEGSGVSRLICNGADGSTLGTFEVFTANSGGTGSVKLGIDAAGAATIANGLTLTDGNLVVANGHGIDFSATSGTSAGASSELLDDYEEGEWTMGIVCSSAATVSIPNTTGRYTKVGNLVTVSIYTEGINVSAAGGGFLDITGLPFTVAAGSKSYSAASFAHTDLFSTTYAAYPAVNTTFARVTQVGSIADASLSAGSPRYMMFSLTYSTDV